MIQAYSFHTLKRGARSMALAVGDMAPDFTVWSDKMFKIKLSSMRGSKLLLLFFPLAFTST
jgi:peroxiredoxin